MIYLQIIGERKRRPIPLAHAPTPPQAPPMLEAPVCSSKHLELEMCDRNSSMKTVPTFKTSIWHFVN